MQQGLISIGCVLIPPSRPLLGMLGCQKYSCCKYKYKYNYNYNYKYKYNLPAPC